MVSTPEQDPFRLDDEDAATEPPTPPAETEPKRPAQPGGKGNLDEEGQNGFDVIPLEEAPPTRVPAPAAPPPPEPTPTPDENAGDGFRVVPLTEAAPQPDQHPDQQPDQQPARERAPEEAPRRPARPVRDPDDEAAVDTRTVAERRGDAVAIVAGRRAPPEGWPAEAFSFPLRAPGPQTIAVAALLLTGLDLVSRANFFFGLILKLVAAILFLRWQLHVATKTAAGHDVPSGWAGAMELTSEKIRGVGILLVAALVLAGPGIVADVLERPGLAIVLFLAGGVLLAAGALGQVVGDPTLVRPWNALAWIARHPLGLLATTAGWWAAGWTEILIWWMRDAPIGLFIAGSLALRLAGMYLWLLSARALGVVGRSWSLFADDAPEDAPAATSPE